jgi:gas vesicle protein
MLIVGLLLGLITGGLVALFKAPISGRQFREQVSESVATTGQNIRSTVESVVPSDPVAESLAAGKAAARRRAEFGLQASNAEQ